MNLVWTREALSDRIDIREYIAQDNLAAALTLDELFSEKACWLLDHPQIGRSGRLEGTRELVVHPSYVMIYDITPDSVRVLRILHGARQWPPFMP